MTKICFTLLLTGPQGCHGCQKNWTTKLMCTLVSWRLRFCKNWRNCEKPSKLNKNCEKNLVLHEFSSIFIIKQAWLSGTSKIFLWFFCQIDYCEWGKWFISHSTRRQRCQWWRWQIRLKVLLQTFCWTWTPIVATKQQRIDEDKLCFFRVRVNFKTN